MHPDPPSEMSSLCAQYGVAALLLAGVFLVLAGLFSMWSRSMRRQARSRAEEALATGSAYRELIENMPVLICRFLPNGEITYANHAYLEYFGKTSEELIGKTFLTLIPEEDRQGVLANLSALTVESPSQSHEHRVIAPGGEIRWQRWTNRGFFDDKGYAVAFQAMGEDVTGRRRMEDALRQSEQRYRGIYDESVTAIYVFDSEKRFIDSNEAGLALLGYSRNELLGLSIPDVDANPDAVLPSHAQLLSGERITLYEHQLRRKDGTIITVLNNSRPITDAAGTIVGMQSTLLDITERKRAEEEQEKHLRFLENLNRIDRIIRTSGDLDQMLSDVLEEMLSFFHCDRAWLFYPCDPSASEWHVPKERTAPEWPGAHAEGSAIPMTDPMREEIRAALTAGEPVLRCRRSDFSENADWLERFSIRAQLLTAIHPRTGKPWLFGLHQCSRERDWTPEEVELFKATAQRMGDAISSLLYLRDLRQREADLREAQRLAHIGGWTHDMRTDEIIWSDEVFEIAGLSPCRVTEALALSLVHPEDLAALNMRREEAALRGKGEHEFRIIRPDGAVRHIYARWIIFHDDSGREIKRTGTYQDITAIKKAELERLELERQVQHAQKLESLGVLAGGIAHDFNNILSAVLGNADLALQDLSPLSPARDNIQEIEKAARRASGLAKQMLAYSGRGKFVIEPIQINILVEEMAHLLEVSISKKIVLKYNFAASPLVFDGDPTQIRQIIMNLITNASEAIGDQSGVISFSTGVMECDRLFLDSLQVSYQVVPEGELPEGAYVYFEVSDTGCGMGKAVIEKIFDPFYTTKFTGRGLGMAAVLGIVRGHRGAIKIYSEMGKGTTFKVLFPASRSNSLSPANGIEGGPATEWRGTGTVLVADDEETILSVSKRMLNRIGFSVLSAADGREAVDMFRDHAEEIVCVLLDLTMPRLDGEQVYRELRKIRPNVRVILSSGYNEQDATKRFGDTGLAAFLQKPYQLADLIEKLKAVIDPI